MWIWEIPLHIRFRLWGVCHTKTVSSGMRQVTNTGYASNIFTAYDGNTVP